MKKFALSLFVVLSALLLLPTNVHAFFISPPVIDNKLTVYLGELPGDVFGLELWAEEGDVSNVDFLAIGISPFASSFLKYVGHPVDPDVSTPRCIEDATQSLKFVGTITSVPSEAIPLVDCGVDPTLPPPSPPLVVVANGGFVGDTDPVQATFSVAAGRMLTVDFMALQPTLLGPTTVSFVVCSTFDCFFDAGNPLYSVNVDITILRRNTVPEPATLWLAAAALIAGGLMFRKDSKSS